MIQSEKTENFEKKKGGAMKLNYYGYSFGRMGDSKKFLMDINPFLKAFCKFDNPKFKTKFSHAGEKVFLLPSTGNLYLFLITKSKEIIKKISARDLSVSEIYALLQKEEMLGFASYVYIDKYYLGYASTIMAPRATTFAEFINQLLEEVGITNYSFVLTPLVKQATRNEVLRMPFIGKSVIQVGKENTLFENVRDLVGGTAEEFEDVDSFEIVLKPRRRQNIAKAAKRMLRSTSDHGLDKVIMKAREDMHGALVDMYLAGKGMVSDTLDTKDERFLYTMIKEKMSSNQMLKAKVKEYESDDCFEKASIKNIARFHNVDSWT